MSDIIHDTSNQTSVRGDTSDMADLLFIIEWMYAKGWPMFGKDAEIDRAIARVKKSLTRSMDTRECDPPESP